MKKFFKASHSRIQLRLTQHHPNNSIPRYNVSPEKERDYATSPVPLLSLFLCTHTPTRAKFKSGLQNAALPGRENNECMRERQCLALPAICPMIDMHLREEVNSGLGLYTIFAHTVCVPRAHRDSQIRQSRRPTVVRTKCRAKD